MDYVAFYDTLLSGGWISHKRDVCESLAVECTCLTVCPW